MRQILTAPPSATELGFPEVDLAAGAAYAAVDNHEQSSGSSGGFRMASLRAGRRGGAALETWLGAIMGTSSSAAAKAAVGGANGCTSVKMVTDGGSECMRIGGSLALSKPYEGWCV